MHSNFTAGEIAQVDAHNAGEAAGRNQLYIMRLEQRVAVLEDQVRHLIGHQHHVTGDITTPEWPRPELDLPSCPNCGERTFHRLDCNSAGAGRARPFP